MKQFVVVSYDITDDRRRLKVMKTMRNFGTHVQYSVFECRLNAKELEELRGRLKKLIGNQDSVRLYFISADDVSRIEVVGRGEVTPEAMFYLH